MSEDNYNKSELIEAVHRRPCLYDKKHVEYKEPKPGIWDEVATEVTGIQGESEKPSQNELLSTLQTGSMPALDGGACATFTSASARSSKMFLAVLRQRKPASFGHTFRRCCGWTITLPLAKRSLIV